MKTLSNTLKNLVKILNDGEFHSGEALGGVLKISRNAVWKHINQLEKQGIVIETVQGKGYRLLQPLILLDNKTIKKHLSDPKEFNNSRIKLLGSVTSTQDYVKLQGKFDSVNPFFCIAEHQTLGRGRFGRHWVSPFASNIYFSCGWQVNKDVSKLSGLSLVIALSITRALMELGVVEDITVKWPNDILWQGKKLAGVLIEMVAESHGLVRVIIGIGMNVNMTGHHNKIDRVWVSLQQILGKYQDRNKMIGLLINYLLQYLEDFNRYGFNYFISHWMRYDYLHGKTVTLRVNEEETTGIVMGVNDQGHLILQKQGRNYVYSVGETSVKLPLSMSDCA